MRTSCSREALSGISSPTGDSLLAVQQFDTGTVIANTNGKNLLRWFVEEKGVICDPHSHENGYNYADVAYLHEQLGIMATKVVGGFL